jgi:hypothetical protein
MADSEDELDTIAGEEFDPTIEPKASRIWLAMITEAERAFSDYQTKVDNIDKQYANLERLANTVRDREFQLFWANVQVLGPSIYSREPVPVVVPRFKDRKPLQTLTSELLERASVSTFQIEDIDATMLAVRDDMTIAARGQVWLRYEAKGDDGALTERVCIEHKDRKDFLHQPARRWKEVDWVASRAWLTKQEMRKRFRKTSGDAYKSAAYEARKDDINDQDDGRLKAGVWEIWSRSQNRVVWVSEGCDKLLDDGKPHLTLEDFFPCPRPAYATVQRRSLIPVPDMLFYKDQLEEINEMTARISALAEAVKVRGFYPAGNGEIGDAIEAAIKSTTNNQILIPISNWAMLGGGSPKDTIVWLPVDMIVATIEQLVALRKQLIDDVYQITGLSDIMRGSTDASETLGAQELKSQYGSIRVRDRQNELIRFARDIVRIAAEIMAENFQPQTLLDMSQMDIPSDADLKKQAAPLTQQLQQMQAEIQHAASDPETQQLAQQNPQQAQQIVGQVKQQAAALQQQIQKIGQQPTIEQVMKLLRDQRLRPFMLDIETDSTIAPDENAQKQRATEYITAVGGVLAQVLPALQMVPAAAPLFADAIRFVQSQYRVGRQMDQTVDEFVEAMKQMATQPKPQDPAAAAAAAKQQSDGEAQKAQLQISMQAHQADMQAKQADTQIKVQDAAQKAETHRQDIQAKMLEIEARMSELHASSAANQQKHAQEMQKGASGTPQA